MNRLLKNKIGNRREQGILKYTLRDLIRGSHIIHEVRKLRAHFLTILLLISSRVGLTQPSLTDHTKAASGTGCVKTNKTFP